ncbi:MAG TPA: Rrf2 family transcriptional regulator [Phycisphaerales bacterium]|nr:Rrf2 family transcriptional regulator [Phycisphaerales bacterium]
MRISKRCQYALKAVFELARRNSGQPVKIHDIADTQNIPPRFLEVILNQLRHGGFVDSRRGNEGGYMLARTAEELTVGQIIRCVQGSISVTDGNSEKPNKTESFFGDCAFDQLWQRIDNAVSQICDGTSFAELVEYEMAEKTVRVPNYVI